jgi:sec-independent protein translocase protein TatB
MFDVGFWELVILFGLGLVILGPERLPKVAMQVGNWAGQARRMARTLTTQMKEELDLNQPYTPPKPTYNRPGMDDLKPQSADEEEDDIENSIYEEPDDRDHTDAGAEDVEPSEPSEPSEPEPAKDPKP